jgi:hypothetical protein
MDRILMLAIAVAIAALLAIAAVQFAIRHIRLSRDRSGGAAMISRLVGDQPPSRLSHQRPS